MKQEKEIKKKLDELKADERLTYKAATVFENAPLAMIQLNAEAQIHILEWVLGLPYSTFPLPKSKKQS